MTTAERVIDALRAADLTLAAAESLTGGLVCAGLTDVPGASTVLRGGAVTYATDTKAALLGVDPDLLAAGGAVQAPVAEAMARGVRALFGADVGLATTGVAGPEPQDETPVGSVFVAVATATATRVEQLSLTGDRAAIRTATVQQVLQLVLRSVAADHGGGISPIR